MVERAIYVVASERYTFQIVSHGLTYRNNLISTESTLLILSELGMIKGVDGAIPSAGAQKPYRLVPRYAKTHDNTCTCRVSVHWHDCNNYTRLSNIRTPKGVADKGREATQANNHTK